MTAKTPSSPLAVSQDFLGSAMEQIHVAEFYAFPDSDRSAVGFLFADDQPEKRRFPRAVGADDSDDAAGRKAEGYVI